MNQEAVLALVSRRLGDFLGDSAIELSEEELGAVTPTFYGISQGAILGAGYTEFSSLVRRACLSGASLCLLFVAPPVLYARLEKHPGVLVGGRTAGVEMCVWGASVVCLLLWVWEVAGKQAFWCL